MIKCLNDVRFLDDEFIGWKNILLEWCEEVRWWVVCISVALPYGVILVRILEMCAGVLLGDHV